MSETAKHWEGYGDYDDAWLEQMREGKNGQWYKHRQISVYEAADLLNSLETSLAEVQRWREVEADQSIKWQVMLADMSDVVVKLETDLAEAQGAKAELHEATGRLSERLDEVLEQLAEAQNERDEAVQWRDTYFGRWNVEMEAAYSLGEQVKAAEQQLAEVKAKRDELEQEVRDLITRLAGEDAWKYSSLL